MEICSYMDWFSFSFLVFIFMIYGGSSSSGGWCRWESVQRESLGKKRTTVSGFFLYAFHLIQPQRAPPAQPFNQFCSVVVDFWESNLGRAPKFRYGNLNVIQKQNSINLRESRDFPQETFIHPEWKNPKRLPHFTPSRYVVSWIPFFPICTQCLFGADNLGRNIMSMG